MMATITDQPRSGQQSPVQPRRPGRVSLFGWIAWWFVRGIGRQIAFDSKAGYVNQRHRSTQQWFHSKAPRLVKGFFYVDEMVTQLGKRAALHTWKTLSRGTRRGIAEGRARHAEHMELREIRREYPPGSMYEQEVRERHRKARADRRESHRVASGLPPKSQPASQPSVGADSARRYQVRQGMTVITGFATQEEAERAIAGWESQGHRGMFVEPEGTKAGARRPPSNESPVPVAPIGNGQAASTTTPGSGDAAGKSAPAAAQPPPSSNGQSTPSGGTEVAAPIDYPQTLRQEDTSNARTRAAGNTAFNNVTGNGGGGGRMSAVGEVSNVPALQQAIRDHVIDHANDVPESTGQNLLTDFQYYEQHRSAMEQGAAGMHSAEAVRDALAPLMDQLTTAKVNAEERMRGANADAEAVAAAGEKAITALQPLANLGEEAAAIKAGDDLKVLKPA